MLPRLTILLTTSLGCFAKGRRSTRRWQRRSEAALRYKQLGQRLVVWRDGETVFIPPEEIEIPELPKDR